MIRQSQRLRRLLRKYTLDARLARVAQIKAECERAHLSATEGRIKAAQSALARNAACPTGGCPGPWPRGLGNGLGGGGRGGGGRGPIDGAGPRGGRFRAVEGSDADGSGSGGGQRGDGPGARLAGAVWGRRARTTTTMGMSRMPSPSSAKKAKPRK